MHSLKYVFELFRCTTWLCHAPTGMDSPCVPTPFLMKITVKPLYYMLYPFHYCNHFKIEVRIREVEHHGRIF